jgi:hypothetical protein
MINSSNAISHAHHDATVAHARLVLASKPHHVYLPIDPAGSPEVFACETGYSRYIGGCEGCQQNDRLFASQAAAEAWAFED